MQLTEILFNKYLTNKVTAVIFLKIENYSEKFADYQVSLDAFVLIGKRIWRNA